MSKLSTTLGRSGNPALTSEVFSKSISSYGETMTLQGTVNKTAFSLFLLIAAGSFTFSPDYSWLIWPGFIGGFIVAMITIFKKTWAPVTVPVYAVLEGLALGGISKLTPKSQFASNQSNIVFLNDGSHLIAPVANWKPPESPNTNTSFPKFFNLNIFLYLKDNNVLLPTPSFDVIKHSSFCKS